MINSGGGPIGPLSHRLFVGEAYSTADGNLNLGDLFKEYHRKYAVSTLRATFKTYRYWLRQNYSEKHSMDNAIRYGVAQIQSIANPESIEDSLHDFETLTTISQRLADVLRQKFESSARVEKNRVEASV